MTSRRSPSHGSSSSEARSQHLVRKPLDLRLGSKVYRRCMSYRIAEVAELVGVPATTLRYYEDMGLVDQPARSGNGYRCYDDADLARLRFITATKNLGIP